MIITKTITKTDCLQPKPFVAATIFVIVYVFVIIFVFVLTYPPKSSYMMLSGSTPRSVSIPTTALLMGPGPHI